MKFRVLFALAAVSMAVPALAESGYDLSPYVEWAKATATDQGTVNSIVVATTPGHDPMSDKSSGMMFPPFPDQICFETQWTVGVGDDLPSGKAIELNELVKAVNATPGVLGYLTMKDAAGTPISRLVFDGSYIAYYTSGQNPEAYIPSCPHAHH